jgi:hypothetical protein
MTGPLSNLFAPDGDENRDDDMAVVSIDSLDEETSDTGSSARGAGEQDASGDDGGAGAGGTFDQPSGDWLEPQSDADAGGF